MVLGINPTAKTTLINRRHDNGSGFFFIEVCYAARQHSLGAVKIQLPFFFLKNMIGIK